MTSAQTSTADTSSKGGVVLAILAAAMFVYVIDTTLMNVSISALVEDLDTTVGSVQGAITLYTLTMAAFMLTGGKLGDIWGSKRAFRIGLVIYGLGTTLTAVAPNLGFVIIGWSIMEGLGSALIVPAINTLVRANYEDSRRATAYGVLFGVAAAGAAFGPLIGGWITTAYTWRSGLRGRGGHRARRPPLVRPSRRRTTGRSRSRSSTSSAWSSRRWDWACSCSASSRPPTAGGPTPSSCC